MGADRTLLVDQSLLRPIDDWYVSKDALSFDVNAFLPILQRLSIEDGFVLDYFYAMSNRDAAPILYARRRAAPPLPSRYLLDFLTKSSALKHDSYRDAICALRTDGTPESFVELALFRILGPQFYRVQHANYYDTAPICDTAALERFLDDPGNFRPTELDKPFRLPKDVETRARALDFTPTVAFRAETVTVSLVCFSNFAGFGRGRWTVSRSWPHTERGMEEEILVPYDCGIMF